MIRAILVLAFVTGCDGGTPLSGAPDSSESDAGPTCIQQADICLAAAQVKADVGACRAAWEACVARETDGGQ